jgi:nicotinamidase-related amidase
MAHVLPSGGGKALMNAEDSALLLLDHQSGLFQTVKDITIAELRANVMALARIAALLKLPVITTASVPDGPNGPLMPETAKLAPHAVYVPRHGEVNAWDNDLFVKAVRETGKKTLIMAGVWTGVCVMFPALDAKAAGFNVYAVIDASGDPSENGISDDACTFRPVWRCADHHKCGHLRASQDLESSRSGRNC